MTRLDALIIIAIGITGLLTLVTSAGAGPTIGVIMMLWANNMQMSAKK